MTRARLDGLLLFLLGSVLFVLVGVSSERSSVVSMVDFKSVYFGARCLLQGSDPYRESDLQHVYQTEAGDQYSNPASSPQVVTLYINLPTGFLLTAPFAMLPWGPAHLLWMIVTAAVFILAAYLMWSLGADYSPVASGLLICLFLLNSVLILEIGNAAGIAASLAVIAAWCFIKERSAAIGILCLALSLAVKPHLAGMVWLYLMLAGGTYRKRALQTLALTFVLSLPGILWVSYVTPHWVPEFESNLHATSVHGNLNDPGPASVDPSYHGALIIDLQSALSILRDDPRFYNPATYLISAPLLLIWAIATLRKRVTQEGAWLALAAIAALSMLPLYHRTHDTRLLLLVFPAFAMLWAEGGLTAWFALSLTGLGAAVIGIVPQQFMSIYSAHMLKSIHGLPGKLLTVLFTRPVPLILLLMSIFYLWLYVRHTSVPDPSAVSAKSDLEPPAPVPV